MNHPTQTRWPWHLLRWGLILLAVLATLAAVLVTEENWRSKRDWDNYRRAAEAHGERLDLAFVIPPAVPDDRNFFAAPIVARALETAHSKTNGVNPLDFQIYRGDIPTWITNGGNWQKGTLTDLQNWQHAFRRYSESPAGKTNGFPITARPQTPGADILLALSDYNPALEELRQASLRPEARLPLDYEKGFEEVGDMLPWLAMEKRWAQLLQLRILAELNDGRSQPALDDTKLLLRLIDVSRNQPFLISHLVRIAIQAVSLQPIYEGLAQHRWNDTQLADLDDALAAKDFLADYKLALRGERTCAIAAFEALRLTREEKTVTGEIGTEHITTNSLRWVPSVYFYRNELAFARMYEQFFLPLVDATNHTVSLSVYRRGQKEYTELTNHFSLYNFQARSTFSGLARSVERFAMVQADVDLARVACALERYRLAHNEYPETLAALAPQFAKELPHDIINGAPLHYRRTDDGRFVLYSVGWNELDDNGTIGFNKYGRADLETGDWVWQYPAK